MEEKFEVLLHSIGNKLTDGQVIASTNSIIESLQSNYSNCGDSINYLTQIKKTNDYNIRKDLAMKAYRSFVKNGSW